MCGESSNLAMLGDKQPVILPPVEGSRPIETEKEMKCSRECAQGSGSGQFEVVGKSPDVAGKMG